MPETFKNDYQYYRQWITDAWRETGGEIYNHTYISLTKRKLLGKLNFLSSLVPDSMKSQEALVVLCGAHPNYSAWPLMYTHELIPIIWDCWPKYHRTTINSIKQSKIKTVFCTSSQTCDLIKHELPNTNVYWLPEGIDIDSYRRGPLLRERTIDVLELGRQLQELHQSLVVSSNTYHINHLYSKQGELLFKDFTELTKGLSDAKITICYPRCDTHPEMAGNIETLTQRYWECMLSGTLIVGRSPRELIDFCGYNPVVELNRNSAEEIVHILENIEAYQSIADKNYEYARCHASWKSRMPYLKEKLMDLGYVL